MLPANNFIAPVVGIYKYLFIGTSDYLKHNICKHVLNYETKMLLIVHNDIICLKTYTCGIRIVSIHISIGQQILSSCSISFFI